MIAEFLFQVLLMLGDLSDFESRLSAVKKVWNDKEKQYLPSGAKPAFYDYIQEKVGIDFFRNSLLP